MKTTTISLFLLAAVTLTAFKDEPEEHRTTRTFGICDCEKTGNGPNFQVTINDDYTFHYISTMNPKKPVDITGTWESEKRDFILKDYKSGVKIHNKWKLENKLPCITSRKGMEFSRLCEVRCGDGK